MKIKSALYIAFAVGAMTFASCDQVDMADRYVDVDNPASSGDSLPITRTLLVEEFSGQMCVNCPAGSEALEKMQEVNGGPDKVVVVSIHAGQSMGLAIGVGNGGLATDFGEQLFSRYGLNSEPNAIFDRTSGILSQNNWLTAIVSGLRRESTVALTARPSYSEADRKLTVEVLARATADYTGNVHVWLTEDSIVTMQLLPTGPVGNHLFNNIFRASATPIDGVPVTIGKGADEKVVYTAEITLAEGWQPRNMSVVAFVDNASGVMQTVRADVLPAE